jgi:hypothetical protein
MPWRVAVARQERMAQKASAPCMERMQPETSRNPQVMGEPEIVIGAAAHPFRESVPFSLQLAAADGVQDDPGVRRVAEPAIVLVQGFRVDPVVPGGAAGAGWRSRARPKSTRIWHRWQRRCRPGGRP